MSDFKEEDIPKKFRNRKTNDLQFKIPTVLVITAAPRDDPAADTAAAARGQSKFYTFTFDDTIMTPSTGREYTYSTFMINSHDIHIALTTLELIKDKVLNEQS